MKKLFFLAVFGLLVSGLYAQNAFSGYETDKNTGVAAHVFGASATVINFTNDYDCLELRWIGKAGLPAANDYLSTTVPTPTTPPPTPRTNNIEIGFDFPFAEKTMKYFGLTAGGMVFFGENDELVPVVNLSNQIATKATDYVFFICSGIKTKWSTNYTPVNKSLAAGTNTCVRYEKVADTLFIAYENLQVKDLHNNVLTVSFQYAFDKSGKCSFRPVSMSPTAPAVTTGDSASGKGSYWWACSLGLVAKNGASGNMLFIKADGTPYSGRAYIDITQASHPLAGESYNFVPSNLCKEIASPQVNWAYDVMGTSLILKDSKEEHMTWNAEAKSALFVLSPENPLTGANRPQNGTVYADNSTIGTSAFVTTGKFNDMFNRNCFQKGTVENLESSTTYYLYAFPYTEGCGGGPVYNVTNAPMISFRTNYKEPASLSANNVTSTSAELQVAIDAKAGHYLLAFDTFQLDQQIDMKIDETKTYAAGDKITFGTRQLTILDPCASNATYTLTNLKQGKEYYYYAWSVNAEQNWYSRLAARCGVAPVRTLPATINFNAAAAVNLKLENGPLPAGWEEESNNTYEYAVREVLNRKVLSVQSTGYGAENPDDKSKVLLKSSLSAIVSPYVNRGESENGLKATIELAFWALDGNDVISSAPNETNTMFVECEDADGQWQEIARAKGGTGMKRVESGVYTLTIPIFMPKETFRLRIKVKDSTELPSETVHTVYYAGISNILIESLSAPDPGPGPDDPEPSCKAALNLQVEDGSLLPDGVTLVWEDENEIAPREYRVLYKEQGEEEWNVEPINRTRLQLTGLQADGSYMAMVQTYCTYEDSAQSTAITFTLPSIPSCAAPTSLRATHIMSTSVDLSWKGKGLNYAVIYAPREGDVKIDTLYTEQTSISLTNLIPDMAYSVYVVSYCGEEYTLPSRPSAWVYFNTPALCRAPRIEVVENSVTWQGVHLAIIDAPSPDRQIRIIPKDEECPIEKYELTSSKDTVKLYGFIDCENITYLAMVRSICTVDTSEWSESVEFTTLPKPSCGAPSNLQASVDESGRTATVSWTAGEHNQSWILMHKERSAQRYDSLPNVRETSATFYGLKPNTVYTWRVQAFCDRNLFSDLVYGNNFTTSTNPDLSLSSAQFADKLQMRVDANQIVIENTDGMYLKTLEVISMNGKRLKTYEIHSSDNVLIPHTLPFGPAVFRIMGKGGETAVYKLLVK